MLPWQPFSAFCIWGAHWRHLKNMTEPSMCGGDAALRQITLTTCCICSLVLKLQEFRVAPSPNCEAKLADFLSHNLGDTDRAWLSAL